MKKRPEILKLESLEIYRMKNELSIVESVGDDSYSSSGHTQEGKGCMLPSESVHDLVTSPTTT